MFVNKPNSNKLRNQLSGIGNQVGAHYVHVFAQISIYDKHEYYDKYNFKRTCLQGKIEL